MNNKPSSSNSDKSPPAQGMDENEKLMRSAESWLLRMCQSGRASWDSDPERVARFLQEFGNEKLGLNIPIDINEIRVRLLTMDEEIKKQREFLSSGNDGGRPAPGRRLFIRKRLQKTDVDRHQGRLSMPYKQVDEGVLTAEEAGRLRAGEKMAAKMVDGEGREYDVELKWAKIGVHSSNYTIRKPWNDIKNDNGFREGMVVEIWGVRGERGELTFHLKRGDA